MELHPDNPVPTTSQRMQAIEYVEVLHKSWWPGMTHDQRLDAAYCRIIPEYRCAECRLQEAQASA